MEQSGEGTDTVKAKVHRLPGLVLTDHEFTVPLDYAQPGGEQIGVFAREVVAAGKENADLPWLVFFQGGPGFGAPRPEDNTGWLKRALAEYRVLLLDQRGTGRSTPVNYQTLARFPTAHTQADYLKQFRADSIVRDAESIRRALLGKDGRWSVLGQSYGGFCVTRYLSASPEGLREAIITGGLPPLERSLDDVYRATYQRVLEKNGRYYERYPDDTQRAWEIAHYLAAHDVCLSNGDRLSPRRFQQLGIAFGFSNGFEQVHYLIEDAFAFETNPIYAILHESVYCQAAASDWSAERIRFEYPEFDLSPDRPVCFTGEMIYPWMFDEYKYLRPMKEAAALLATYDEWPRLYDMTVLQANTVPCAAAIYYDDMYVERTFSEETARNIQGSHIWVTNEYEHNALRSDGETVLNRLLGVLHGEI